MTEKVIEAVCDCRSLTPITVWADSGTGDGMRPKEPNGWTGCAWPWCHGSGHIREIIVPDGEKE